jgi:hypothetical protein
MNRPRQWRPRLLIGFVLLVVLTPPALFGLNYGIRAHERLHYGLHLVAGRVLSLTPWTEGLAEDQYYRATYHAHTPRQRALVTTDRPDDLPERIEDGARVAWWSARAVGRHPAREEILVAGVMMVLAGGLLLGVRRRDRLA